MTRFFLVRGVIVRIIVRIPARAVFALGTCGLIACSQATSTNGAVAAQSGSITARVHADLVRVPVRDLKQDEEAGGHILRKHVGQTEQQLRDRLERERNITGASTYADLWTAEHAVGAAITQSQGQIQNWLNEPGRHPNLVLDYDTDVPLGRTMNRGEVHSRVCEHAVVVLKYTGPNNYYVLTSYPECR